MIQTVLGIDISFQRLSCSLDEREQDNKTQSLQEHPSRVWKPTDVVDSTGSDKSSCLYGSYQHLWRSQGINFSSRAVTPSALSIHLGSRGLPKVN